MTDTNTQTLAVTMQIPPHLLEHFEPGKLVELVLPDGFASFFHVDTASWSNVNGEDRHSIALSFVSPERVTVRRGIPRFNLEHAARC